MKYYTIQYIDINKERYSMKILEFKGKISLKNKLLILAIIILLAIIAGVVIAYIVNEEARDWININILRKEVTEDDVATIEINTDKTQYIYSYNKYIAILCNGKLEIYNSYASKVHELDIEISNPIFDSNNQYLLIAENGRAKNMLNIRAEKYNGKIE